MQDYLTSLPVSLMLLRTPQGGGKMRDPGNEDYPAYQAGTSPHVPSLVMVKLNKPFLYYSKHYYLYYIYYVFE